MGEKLKPKETKDSQINDVKKEGEKMDIEDQEPGATTGQRMETNEDAPEAEKEDTKKKNLNKKKKITLKVTTEFFTKNMTPVKEGFDVEFAMKELDDQIMTIQNTRNYLETLIYEVRD